MIQWSWEDVTVRVLHWVTCNQGPTQGPPISSKGLKSCSFTRRLFLTISTPAALKFSGCQCKCSLNSRSGCLRSKHVLTHQGFSSQGHGCFLIGWLQPPSSLKVKPRLCLFYSNRSKNIFWVTISITVPVLKYDLGGLEEWSHSAALQRGDFLSQTSPP